MLHIGSTEFYAWNRQPLYVHFLGSYRLWAAHIAVHDVWSGVTAGHAIAATWAMLPECRYHSQYSQLRHSNFFFGFVFFKIFQVWKRVSTQPISFYSTTNQSIGLTSPPLPSRAPKQPTRPCGLSTTSPTSHEKSSVVSDHCPTIHDWYFFVSDLYIVMKLSCIAITMTIIHWLSWILCMFYCLALTNGQTDTSAMEDHNR